MKIIAIRVLRGPNYWSNYHKKLIDVELDLEHYEKLPTNKIHNFPKNLESLIPSLYDHFCSEDKKGGFLERLKDGTWLGHVVEHVALELQCLAGMNCSFGRTRSSYLDGIYHVVFSYEVEEAGIYAAKTAVEIVQTLAENKPYEHLIEDLKELKHLYLEAQHGPSTDAILKEAKKRNIPCQALLKNNLLILGQGANQKRIWTTATDNTSLIATDIAGDKTLTKKILAENFIPVPTGTKLYSLEDLNDYIEEFGYPLVLKPAFGNHGRGVTTNITNAEKAKAAFLLARQFSDTIIAEKFIKGSDYRFLVINFKLVAAAKRTPACVVGDGISSIEKLINVLNLDPRRGEGHDNDLTKITIDDITLALLSEKNLTLESVLEKNKILYLKNAANLSSGGTATDVTDLVHPCNIFLAERIARIIGLDICGIDVVIDDVSQPLTPQNGAVIEVNAGPGFRMHLNPSIGKPRNVAAPVLDMLFPENIPSRIPIVAVTGTNGKTTVVRLIAHIAEQSKKNVGYTTTEGIYINRTAIKKGDCSGPLSAERILQDPLVDIAVLECARGGILRSGLGFDFCNVGIITNIAGDHLGFNGVHTMEELARAKAVVARSVHRNGFAILNADDDLVFAIKEDLDCQVALFSLDADNPRIMQHCDQDGLAAYIKNNKIIIRKGKIIDIFGELDEFPITFNGSATSMIKNILPAILAGISLEYKVDLMQKALKQFYPTPELLPGRMNIFRFKNFKVLLDYAHNEDAFINLQQYMETLSVSKKIGIIAATGNRREEDIQKNGYYAAKIFDEIIIRHDRDGRGRTDEELTKLLCEGIKQANKPVKVSIISRERKAIEHALNNATKGSFIYFFPEDPLGAIEYLKQEQKIRARHLEEI